MKPKGRNDPPSGSTRPNAVLGIGALSVDVLPTVNRWT